MASVFLSYSREDVAKAEAVAAALERLGHSVWWDRRIHGGSRFSKEIDQALKGSDVVLVLWSHASVESAWVQDEAAEGRDSGRLVPVVIDDSKPPLGFRQYQAIDFSGWKGRANAPAIDSLHQAILARAGSAPPVEAPAKVSLARRDYRRPGIVAVSLLVFVVAGLLCWFVWPAARQDSGALRLQLGQFEALSEDVPRKVPETLREELLGALSTDAVILASTDPRPAGSEPGYALTSSIGRAEDLLRFTIHLVNKRTGATVWTETFERPAAIQDIAPRQVAVAVSQLLRCGLGGAARYRKPMPDTTLSIFFDYCEEYWGETVGKPDNPARALDLARRVTTAAPDFSGGWSGLAEVATWNARGSSLVNADALRSEASAAAKRALDLDKENSEAYQALAGLEPPLAFAAREKLHLKSISVRPSDCGCEYVGYGSMLSRVGRDENAADAFKRAHDMIPLSPDVNANFIEALLVVGRIDEARQAVTNVLQLWPDDPRIRRILVRSGFWTGRYNEALLLLADPKTPLSGAEREALGEALRAMKGGSASSKAGAAKQLEALAVDASTDGPLLVTALAALGAQQKALALAAARIEQGGPPALRVLFEPPLAPARQSPQFAQLAQRFGLVSYWRQSRNLPDFCKKASPPALCASL